VPAANPASTVDYLGLQQRAMEAPWAQALVAPGRDPLNYAELWNHLSATSAALDQAGVHAGSVAALALRNGPDFLTAALAITLRSACAPLDLDLTRDECRIKLERIRASTLLLEDGVASPAGDVARELGMRVIHVRCSPDAPAGIFELGDIEDPSGIDRGRQTDAALILMTTATTDAPKLVPRSRAALQIAATYNRQAFQLTAADRYLSCMPLSLSHGMSEAMTQLTLGGLVFCAPAFQADKFCSWVERFLPTWFSVSPTINRTILTLARENPEIFERVPLRFIRSAAATPDPEVLLALEQLLNVPVLNGYGLTEVASAIRSTPSARKPGAVGKSFGVEIAVMDESGNLLPPDVEGEILLRGPTVMSGYLDNPEANQTAFHNGWFRTGDLGRLDRDGFLFIVGRRKEMINRGGKKILPQEVDLVLARHPAIADAATFAIPHRSLGEDVAAAVVLRPDARASELDLRQFAARQLSAYKVPRRIVFVESIPRTTLGKLKRSALADQFKDLGAPGSMLRPKSIDTERTPTAMETQLIGIWRRILSVEHVGIDDSFFDLGGDSLSAALMLAQAEKLLDPAAGPLDGSDFYDCPTVAALAGIMAQSAARRGREDSINRILLLQKHGSRVPFFCFSNSRINPYQFRHLSRELGPDQPFFVVCPPPAAQDRRLLRAQEIARQSAASIRALRTHGPYLIGGYCYGGVLAFETARQLVEDGEDVALLALFDTPTPGYPKIVRQWRGYTRRASEIFGAWVQGKPSVTAHEIADHLRALCRIVTRRWFAKANRVIASAGVPDAPATEAWNSVVMREYTPQIFRAPIVHFLGDDVAVNASVLNDRRLGWQDFAKGGFETRRVPGDHVSMLAEGNAPALADALEQVLMSARPDLPARVAKMSAGS
jgi:acyl-CoA synthetase (AMP-forming)/AMP-acid ligase II/thioesterase domain-containing protein